MVDFVAYRMVNIKELGELGHIADTGPSDIHGKSSTGFTITQGEDHRAIVDFVATGHDIKYLGGILPHKGTITHLTVKVAHEKAYEFSNDSYSVATALKIYLQDDAFLAARSIFAGNDKISGSKFDDELFGFNGNDEIFGRKGDDELEGGKGDDRVHGGDGNDKLKGDAGNDRFYFDISLDPSKNVDTIVDFDIAHDRIVLDRSVFSAIGALGPLADARFVVGDAATAESHRIIYDDTTGRLFYDADGSGEGAAVRFGKVSAGLDLSHSDFLVVA